jgi:hypothetical protein
MQVGIEQRLGRQRGYEQDDQAAGLDGFIHCGVPGINKG